VTVEECVVDDGDHAPVDRVVDAPVRFVGAGDVARAVGDEEVDRSEVHEVDARVSRFGERTRREGEPDLRGVARVVIGDGPEPVLLAGRPERREFDRVESIGVGRRRRPRGRSTVGRGPVGRGLVVGVLPSVTAGETEGRDAAERPHESPSRPPGPVPSARAAEFVRLFAGHWLDVTATLVTH